MTEDPRRVCPLAECTPHAPREDLALKPATGVLVRAQVRFPHAEREEYTGLRLRGETLSSGEIHPLSVSLQHGIRLLPHPFDAVLSARLTVRFPVWEDNGVASFIS